MARAKKASGQEALAEPAPSDEETITSIKGFGRDWKCRDFQFAPGQTYEHVGEVEACESGFHAISGHPLEVFGYYAPGQSRYAEVTQSGKLARHSQDSKVASAKITIGVELRLHELVQRAVKYVWDRCTISESEKATGDQGAASSTGHRGAASSTGDQGAASSTGDQGAASSTGDQGAASSTGHRGAASSTGYRGAASSTGDQGAAMAVGHEGRAMGTGGNALFLVYRDPGSDEILHAWAGIVGRDGIKPEVWYQLGADGLPTEVV